jgi:phosphatidyl-myo-inositol dimannoside synthase
MSRPLRVLSIGHSYSLGVNRALPRAMQTAGGEDWHVEVVAPKYYAATGDIRSTELTFPLIDSVPVHGINAYNTRRVHAFMYGYRLKQLLAQDWDIVHAWEEPYIVAGTQIANWTPRRTKLIFRSAQSLNKTYPPPFNWMERYSIRRADGWICSGRTVEANLQSRKHYDQIPHACIPLGVDSHLFRPQKVLKQQVLQTLGWDADGPPVVGFLGRFVPEKGLRILMQALDGLKTPWRAMFVGSGVLETEMRKCAAPYGDRVRLCTEVKHAEVPTYLQAMDVLACPSQTTPRWQEQFGRMIIEAFASGVPVIGSNSGEIPHVVGSTGIIVPEADVSAWTEQLGKLLDDPARRKTLANDGRFRAIHEFDWSVIGEEHLSFFEQILGNNSHSGETRLLKVA